MMRGFLGSGEEV